MILINNKGEAEIMQKTNADERLEDESRCKPESTDKSKIMHWALNHKPGLAAAVSAVSLVVGIAANVANFGLASEQNRLAEKYERLNTYTSPLTYTLDLSDEGLIHATPQNNSEPQEIKGKSINIIPAVGGIAKTSAVIYQNGTIAAILPLTLETNGSIAAHDASETFWTLPEYSVPILGYQESTGHSFGTLFLLIQDYQGNYTTNMITYTFDLQEAKLIDCHIYWPIDTLYTINDEEFNEKNLGRYESGQLKQYAAFLDLVSKTAI